MRNWKKIAVPKKLKFRRGTKPTAAWSYISSFDRSLPRAMQYEYLILKLELLTERGRKVTYYLPMSGKGGEYNTFQELPLASTLDEAKSSYNTPIRSRFGWID